MIQYPVFGGIYRSVILIQVQQLADHMHIPVFWVRQPENRKLQWPQLTPT